VEALVAAAGEKTAKQIERELTAKNLVFYLSEERVSVNPAP
jgi:hypothetical protein